MWMLTNNDQTYARQAKSQVERLQW